jgi:predicted nucleic acid-binding protein
MIILDTNVLSELMRATPAPSVVGWLNEQSADSVYLTSITTAEIWHGVELLPKGKRREAIAGAAEAMFAEDFDGRVLAFGTHAAAAYAVIAADRQRRGRPIATLDAQIAGIARSGGAVRATRNGRAFEGCGGEIVDPFAA